MNTRPVKTAVIGCGMISEAYLNALSTRFKIIDVTVCCDSNREKAEAAAKKHGIQAMDMKDMLHDQSIELVVNLTPVPAHYQVIKEILIAGKHVYTEKVFSATLDEAKELMALANEKGLYLGVAPDTFLGGAIQTAKYVVDSGMIGQVTSCYAAVIRDCSLLADIIPFTTKVGGGIAFDVGIYYITALLSILGPVKTVTGIMDTKNKIRTHRFIEQLGETYTMECEDIMSGTLMFHSGVLGNLLFDSNSVLFLPEKPVLVINGTLGVVYMNDPNTFGGEVRVLLKSNNTPFVMQQSHPFQEESRGLGAAEMAWSLRKKRMNRANKEMAYHALEVLHGINLSGMLKTHYELHSSFEIPPPLPRGYASGTHFKFLEENAIAI